MESTETIPNLSSVVRGKVNWEMVKDRFNFFAKAWEKGCDIVGLFVGLFDKVNAADDRSLVIFSRLDYHQ